MKSAYQKNKELLDRLLRVAPAATLDDAATLRRCALTLTNWGVLECGTSNNYCSWGIERDEKTETPYMIRRPYDSNKVYKTRIADREKGALKRIKATCDRLGLYFYYQTDPRGWPLYVDTKPLPDNNYNQGIGIGE